MHAFNLVVLTIAGSALVLGLGSNALKRWGIPDPVLLLLLGVLLGPLGLGLINPHEWPQQMVVLEQAARLALAVGLMGVALRLPADWIIRHWRSLGAVLLFAMPFMWLSSSLLAGGLLGLPVGAALLLGAIITPTDPVVASSVVTGPVAKATLPAHVRRVISAESGANDGLAYLFVMAGVFVMTLKPQESVSLHLMRVLLLDVVLAITLGIAIGYFAGRALRAAEHRAWIEKPSVLMFTTALALAALTGVKLVGSDGILAVFFAGLAFDRQVNVEERQQEERVVEGVDRFFTSPIFILLGLMLPWEQWLKLGWQGLALVLGVLLLRRLPVLLLLGGRLRALPTLTDGLFAGWFGPLGVAALYYAAYSHHQVHLPDLWPVVSLLVTVSVVVHGFTATPFSHLYSRWQRKAEAVQRESPGPSRQ